MSPNEKEAIALLREVADTKHSFSLQRVTDFLKKIDKWEKEQKRVKRYAEAALAGYSCAYDNEDIDFDDLPWITVSPGGDPGAYVSCWVWVADIDVEHWRRDLKKQRRIDRREEKLKMENGK